MKKILLSMVAAAAVSGTAMAGGDITPAPVNDVSGVYFGLGLSYANMDIDGYDSTGVKQLTADTDANAGMLQLGYRYNEWLGLEARYTYQFISSDVTTSGPTFKIDESINNIGVYLKPQYTFGNITAYALLGYGWTAADLKVTFGGNDYEWDDSHGGFQWGVGAAFALSEHTSVFVDYTQLADGPTFEIPGGNGKVELNDVSTFNVGMTYKF